MISSRATIQTFGALPEREHSGWKAGPRWKEEEGGARREGNKTPSDNLTSYSSVILKFILNI